MCVDMGSFSFFKKKKNAEKIDKLDFIKIKNFSASNKEHFKKLKRQNPQKEENVYKWHIREEWNTTEQ